MLRDGIPPPAPPGDNCARSARRGVCKEHKDTKAPRHKERPRSMNLYSRPFFVTWCLGVFCAPSRMSQYLRTHVLSCEGEAVGAIPASEQSLRGATSYSL